MPKQAEIVAEYMLYLTDFVTEFNSPGEQMERLNTIFRIMREEDLPENLLKLKNNGLTIKWCKDMRSFTKLVPALEMYKNDIIVTVGAGTVTNIGPEIIKP